MPKVETPRARRSIRQARSSATPIPLALESTENVLNDEQSPPEIATPISHCTDAPSGSEQNLYPWRHPAELEFIEPEGWHENQILEYLYKNGFSIPARDIMPASSMPWVKISTCGGEIITLPRGYRIPLMFAAKFQWESLRVVRTSSMRREDWEACKFDILHVARLCSKFLEQARNAKAAGRMDRTWRCPMFDRTLVRYYRRWLVSREEFVKGFWLEFDEEEFENDILKRDWNTFAQRGHKGFCLTKAEIQDGISFEEFTHGLDLGYGSPQGDSVSPPQQNLDLQPPAVDDRSASPVEHTRDAMDAENFSHSVEPSLLASTHAFRLPSEGVHVMANLPCRGDGETNISPTQPDSQPLPTIDLDKVTEHTLQVHEASSHVSAEQEYLNRVGDPGIIVKRSAESMCTDTETIDSDITGGDAPPSNPSALTSLQNGGNHVSSSPADNSIGIDIVPTNVDVNTSGSTLVTTAPRDSIHGSQGLGTSSTLSGGTTDTQPVVDCSLESNRRALSGNASGNPDIDVEMADVISERPEGPPPYPTNSLPNSILPSEPKSDDHGSQANFAADEDKAGLPTAAVNSHQTTVLDVAPAASQIGSFDKGEPRMEAALRNLVMAGARSHDTVLSPASPNLATKLLFDKPRKQNSWEARVHAAMERARKLSKTNRKPVAKSVNAVPEHSDHTREQTLINMEVDVGSGLFPVECSNPATPSTHATQVEAEKQELNRATEVSPSKIITRRNISTSSEDSVVPRRTSRSAVDQSVPPVTTSTGPLTKPTFNLPSTVTSRQLSVVISDQGLAPSQPDAADGSGFSYSAGFKTLDVDVELHEFPGGHSIIDPSNLANGESDKSRLAASPVLSTKDGMMDVDHNIQYAESGTHLPNSTPDPRDASTASTAGYSGLTAPNYQIINYGPVLKQLVSTLQDTVNGLTNVLEAIEQDASSDPALNTSAALRAAPDVSLLNEIQSLKNRIQRDAEHRLKRDMQVQRLQREVDRLRCLVPHQEDDRSTKAELSSTSSSDFCTHDSPSDPPTPSPHPLSHLLAQGLEDLLNDSRPLSPSHSQIDKIPRRSSTAPKNSLSSKHHCLSPSRTPSPSAESTHDDGTPLPIKSKRKHHMLFTDHQLN